MKFVSRLFSQQRTKLIVKSAFGQGIFIPLRPKNSRTLSLLLAFHFWRGRRPFKHPSIFEIGSHPVRQHHASSFQFYKVTLMIDIPCSPWLYCDCLEDQDCKPKPRLMRDHHIRSYGQMRSLPTAGSGDVPNASASEPPWLRRCPS